MQLLAIDRYSRGTSWIHRLDPRLKLIGLACCVAVAVATPARAALVLIPLLLAPPLLCAMAGIPLRLLLRQWFGFAPLLIFLVLWHPLFHHEPAWLWTPGGPWTLTRGWLMALALTVSATLILLATFTLAGTTAMPEILTGLRGLGVPAPLLLQTGFIYRYLFVLRHHADKLAAARRLRDGGRGGRLRSLNSWGNLFGVFLLRSLEHAEEIYGAMELRGFDGSYRSLREARPLKLSWVMLATAAVLPLAAIFYWWVKS